MLFGKGKKNKADTEFIQRRGSELPGAAGITLQESDYGGVTLGAADELFQGELA